MVNFTSADAKANACRQSLAASGAGAFVFEGASIGTRATVMVAPVFLPEVSTPAVSVPEVSWHEAMLRDALPHEVSLPRVRQAAGSPEVGLAGIGGACAVSTAASGVALGASGGSGVFGGGNAADGSGVIGSNVGGVIGGRKVKTQQLIQTTRINPVHPGGVGPHPAREPDPV
ncbi:MAG TPA: hypothetical protein VGI58_09285 [Streptosporangiaceae bacterium]|jgi:hypothetical protein